MSPLPPTSARWHPGRRPPWYPPWHSVHWRCMTQHLASACAFNPVHRRCCNAVGSATDGLTDAIATDNCPSLLPLRVLATPAGEEEHNIMPLRCLCRLWVGHSDCQPRGHCLWCRARRRGAPEPTTYRWAAAAQAAAVVAAAARGRIEGRWRDCCCCCGCGGCCCWRWPNMPSSSGQVFLRTSMTRLDCNEIETVHSPTHRVTACASDYTI